MRAPDKLPQEQLDKYYADPQSAAALANGVLIKWLVEVIDPWCARVARRTDCSSKQLSGEEGGTQCPEGDGGHGYVRGRLPFRRVDVRQDRGQSRDPRFLKVNEMGKVPAVQISNGTVLSDSGALLFFFSSGSRGFAPARASSIPARTGACTGSPAVVRSVSLAGCRAGCKRALADKLATSSVEVVQGQPGFLGHLVAGPASEHQHEFIFASIWANADAVKARFGEQWRASLLPPGYAELIEAYSVDHYHLTGQSLDRQWL